jgi:hypothetical protein
MHKTENLKIRIHKNITLLMFLYVCETWSLALRNQD